MVIRERCRQGPSNSAQWAVIGADGFDSKHQRSEKVPRRCQIDDDVETVRTRQLIRRGLVGPDSVGARLIIWQVAHNVVVGKDTVIAAQTGIAGSVRIGNRVMIGGQAGIIGHIEIADGTMIGAQTGVSKNLNGGVWWATPSLPLKEAKVQLAWVRRLGEFFERVKKLEAKVR